MEKFRKISFSSDDISETDKGVLVSEVLKLVDNHKYYQEFYNLLEIDKIKDDFIPIRGASKLISTMQSVNNKFTKFDVESSYQDLEFVESEKFTITFNNIIDPDVTTIIESDEFTATPIYSAQTDFFSGLFNMDRYANKLLDHGYNYLVNSNLKSIQEILQKLLVKNKKYRILLDKEGNYFLRAITSNRYYDYNNNIAVFVGLIILYKDIKESKNEFIIQRCEFNESYVRVYFENLEEKDLPVY